MLSRFINGILRRRPGMLGLDYLTGWYTFKWPPTPGTLSTGHRWYILGGHRGEKDQLALLLQNLSGYLVALDDLPAALAAARESIGILAARDVEHSYVAINIEHVALAVAMRGDLARAAMLEGYADAAFERHGFPREFNERTTHDRLTALLHKALAPDELAVLIADGAALTPEAAIALALAEP